MFDKYWFSIKKRIEDVFETKAGAILTIYLKLKENSIGDTMKKYCFFELDRLTVSNQSWKFRAYNSHSSDQAKHITFKIKAVGRINPFLFGEALVQCFQNPHQDEGSDDIYTGNLYISSLETFEAIDGIFFDPKKKKLFPIRITPSILTHDKSDSRFFDRLKNREQRKTRTGFNKFIDNVEELKSKGCTIQFIWLGLIDGKFVNTAASPNLIQNKKIEVDENSWIVLVNEDDRDYTIFQGLRLLFSS